MPAALRSDDHIGIAADADGVGVAIQFRDHLDIVEIGEHQLVAALELLESETAPEIHEAFLRVPIQAPIAFLPAKLDARADELERQPRVAEFLANGEALDFRKIGEEAESEASGRLVADISDQVRRREIVAVEFLLIRTFLLADIDRASQACDAHEIFEGARDRDRDVALSVLRAIGVVERGLGRAREGVKLRRVDGADLGALLQAERFVETHADFGVRPCVKVDAGVIGSLEFLEYGCHGARENARRICRPDVNPGRPLMRSREKLEIRGPCVKRVCRKLIQPDLVQKEERDEAVPGWSGRVKLPLACNCPYSVTVVAPDAPYNFVVG